MSGFLAHVRRREQHTGAVEEDRIRRALAEKLPEQRRRRHVVGVVGAGGCVGPEHCPSTAMAPVADAWPCTVPPEALMGPG